MNCEFKKKKIALKLIRIAVLMALGYITIQIAVVLGIEKKSWFERSWDLLAGGSFGAIAGLAFFLLFGAIGWVSGAIYGSLGLLSLMLGGALGGLGLGTIVNIVRDPSHYNFNWLTLIFVLVVGGALAHIVSIFTVKWASKKLPDSTLE